MLWGAMLTSYLKSNVLTHPNQVKSQQTSKWLVDLWKCSVAQQPQHSITMKFHGIGDSEIIQHASWRTKVAQTIEKKDPFNMKTVK